MNRQFVNDIVDSLTKVVGVDKNRVSLAMALAVGYALPLPTQGVEDPETWYRNEYRWRVTQFVSEFNERYLLNTAQVITGAQEVWASRYRGCFVHDRQQMESAFAGNTPASIFIGQYEESLASKTVIAEAAFLLHGQIMPVLLGMGKSSADSK